MKVLLTWMTCLLLGGAVSAQSQPDRFNLSGFVVDPSGAGVSSAQLKLQCAGASSTRSAKCDVAGAFRMANLAPGEYTVEISAIGFATQMFPVHIDGHEPAPLRCTLQLADVRQEVTVNDSSTQSCPASLGASQLRELVAEVPIREAS